jgi:hypothetical protein
MNPTKPARLDKDKKAKPLTRIVHHPKAGARIDPRRAIFDPEYEDEEGERTPLTGTDSKEEHAVRKIIGL